ncbi:hypothetical protein GCM10022226_02620 [Sphaerisporangium flaviroseum]|uniref:CobQ/CobB/MinD/ParA nucleotide binding domain-containing protein n=1 Tax=Sphaerisporangium flaviroseum TaxID=509199 RepID=A0ABP7HB83_9ACTN
MARHDREDPHSLEEQLAWLDAIKENEEAPVPVTVTADDTVVSPYPKDPWAMVPTETPAAASPLFRAAGDPLHSTTQPDDTVERATGEPAEAHPLAPETLDRWGKQGEVPTAGGHTGAFSAPITAPSEPLSRSDTSPSGGSAFGERPAGSAPGAFGERPAASGAGASGERPAASGSGAFGERPAGSGSGAFGERPAGSGSGAFGERSEGSGTGAFGEPPAPSGGGFGAFGERRPSSGTGAFGERPGSSPSGGVLGEAGPSTGPSPSGPSGKQPVSEDTDSFTFGSLAEEPPSKATSGWGTREPLGTSKGEPAASYEATKSYEGAKSFEGAKSYEGAKSFEGAKSYDEPEPDATGDQPVRGWLEAALPAAEPGEADPEQERFNAFVTGTETEDVVVPRVEHPLYEPVTEKAAPPAKRPPVPAAGESKAPDGSPSPAARAPLAAPAQGVRASQAAPTPAANPVTQEKAPEEREPYRPRRRQSPPAAQSLQPAFGAPTRQAGAKGAAGVRPTADSLDPVSLLRGRRNAPAGGWRKLIFKASAGLIKPGDSPEVRRRRELLSRARTPVATGHHRVAVLSLKGGVGKTTTTVGLGATLASVRGDRVIAVDANPDRGTLSDKVELETSATVRDLLNERQQIKRYVDIRAFTSQAPSRLEILASDRDPSVSEAFSAADYQSVAQVLENFYSICLTDCGTGLLHSAMSGVLGLADQLVLVSSPSVDGARAASATLDWLEAHHYADLVKDATVVLCSVRPRSKSTVDLDRLEAHFAARCRAVIRVPYDPHLEEGAEIDLDRLQPATRESYLLLAASVGDGFGGMQV